MGATRTTVTIRNPTAPSRSRDGLLLVDTGAPDSLVPRFCIEAIGLDPEDQRVYEIADDREIALAFVLARIEFMDDVAAARHHRRRGDRTPARTGHISRFPIFIEQSEDRPMETLIRRNNTRAWKRFSLLGGFRADRGRRGWPRSPRRRTASHHWSPGTGRREGRRPPTTTLRRPVAPTGSCTLLPFLIRSRQSRLMQGLLRQSTSGWRARPPRGVSDSGLIPVALATTGSQRDYRLPWERPPSPYGRDGRSRFAGREPPPPSCTAPHQFGG